MRARSPWFVVPCAAFLLAAAPLRAQETAPAIGQPPCDSPSASQLCDACDCGPCFRFQADWLWTSHASLTSDSRNFINGPDAASFNDLPGITGDNGYRFRGELRLGDYVLEGAYWHFGDLQSTFNRNINGVAFNPLGAAGNWAGENSINSGTYFAPIANSANLTVPANTAGDQSGLGPNTAFPGDARPALMAYSNTDFYMTEANVKQADYIAPWFGRGLRLGVGYVNANLNNDSWVGLSGTFRASNAGGTTVSLPNSVLTYATGGNLSLFSGGGSGFTDGVSNGGTGTPSQLLFTHAAHTRNELNGAQFVLDCDLLEYRRMEFGATLKAGIFDNFAQGSIVETYGATNNDLSVYARKFTADCHQLAFLGGVGVNAGYHITDEISINVGYDVLLLTNQALGPEQINGLSNNWYRVQTGGTACIQSVNLGMQIAF